MFNRVLAGALTGCAFICLVGTVACGTAGARAPNPTRPIDEGRAIKIIATSLQREGLEPQASREISYSGGKKVTIDVGAVGKKFGVVYLTSADAHALGEDPIARKSSGHGDDLIVRKGAGDDSAVHFVVLYASDYVYDDNVGEEHEATIITAENKLDRDARDFVIIARKKGWP